MLQFCINWNNAIICGNVSIFTHTVIFGRGQVHNFKGKKHFAFYSIIRDDAQGFRAADPKTETVNKCPFGHTRFTKGRIK